MKVMTMRLGQILLLLVFSLGIFSCQKTSIEDEGGGTNNSRVRMLASEKSFSYGENTFFVGKTQNENLVNPIVSPSGPGKFVSIPFGLSLNSATGTIDLSKSDAGQAYKIFFVDPDGKLADSTRIVISGIDYNDGLYNLKKAKNGKLKAKYNANSSLNVPISFVNSFEEDENDQRDKKLVINGMTGEIDIEATMRTGGFRRSNSNNEFVIKYRINDRSSRRPNKLKIQMYRYSSESDIPEELLNTLKEHEEIMKRVNAMPIGNSSEGIADAFDTESSLEDYAKPVRPPVIIIIN